MRKTLAKAPAVIAAAIAVGASGATSAIAEEVCVPATTDSQVCAFYRLQPEPAASVSVMAESGPYQVRVGAHVRRNHLLSVSGACVGVFASEEPILPTCPIP